MRLLRRGRAGAWLTARSVWQRRWLSLVVFLTASFAAAAAAIGPMYTEAARTSIVRDAFTESPASAQGIMIAWDQLYQSPPQFLDEARQATGIPDAFEPPIRSAEITSNVLNQRDEVKLIWREGSCDRLVLVSGRCPSSAGEVVASDTTSARYNWEIGEPVFLEALIPPKPLDSSNETESVEPLPLTVVGIYEPRNQDETYWVGIEYFPDSSGRWESTPEGQRLLDPLFTDEPTLRWAALAAAPWEFNATLLLDVESLEGEDAESLREAPTLLREWVAGRATVSTSMKGVAIGVIRAQESLDVSVVVVTFELVGLVWLLLFLAVGDLIRARRAEVGLARLRGQSQLQVWRFALAEPVTLLLLALPVGVIAGVPIVEMLSNVLLGSNVEVSAGHQAWLAATGGTLGGLFAAALAARSTLTMSVMEHWRDTRSRAEHRSWVVDAVVIALVVAGLVELTSGGLITEPTEGDATALLVPALVSVAVALLAGRALPYVVRLVLRTTDRRKGVGLFLGLRHAARSQDTTSMVIILTVAFSLAIFALTTWAVTARNHRFVATVHNGAPTVLIVTPPEGSRLTELVAGADPNGQSAVPVAIYDRTARLLAVDTERFPYVANWRSDFTETPLRDLLPQLRPESAPPIMVSGDQIRITVDTRRVPAPELELFVDLELADQVGPVRLPFPPSGHANATVLQRRLPNACHQVCELRGFSVVTGTDADGGTSQAELFIAKVEVHTETGWNTVDAGLTVTGRWRAEEGSERIPAETHATANGLTLTFVTGDLTRVVVATHPPLLPAITLGAVGPRPTGHQVARLDGGFQEVDAVARANVLPGTTGPTALVDYQTAEQAAYGLSSKLEHQVWVTPEAAAQVKDTLRSQGVVITAERTVSDLEHGFNRQGPGLALVLLLLIAAAGAILAMARAAISLYAAGRQRSYQFAALAAIGSSQPSQRAALLIEQAVTLGAGVLAGALAGVTAAVIALPRIPLFTTPPETPPLTYTPDLAVVVGALGISALAVASVVVVTTEAIHRSVRLEQLREATP